MLPLALPISRSLTIIIKRDWKGSKQFTFSYVSTSAFSGASFIQRRYGWQYGKWAYVLAAIVGVSRMEGPDGW